VWPGASSVVHAYDPACRFTSFIKCPGGIYSLGHVTVGVC
jgi:hypothetical protein